MALPTLKGRENPPPLDEVSHLIQLINRARGSSFPATDYISFYNDRASLHNAQDDIRLPGLSAVFPAFSSRSSNCSDGASAYLTPNSDTLRSPANKPAAYVSPYASPHQYALITHLEAVRRGFAFHRKCNRYAFIAYDDPEADELLNEFQASVTENRSLPDSKLCAIFSIAVISSTFNRVQIPAQAADVFYRAATERIGDWMHSQHLTAMRCCALLGLANLFRKATVSLLYFDFAIALTHKLWPAMRSQYLDMSLSEHVELQRVWRSLVFCRAWLQSTIGACTTDAQLWFPPIKVETNSENEVQAVAQIVTVQLTSIAVLAAKAMRVLTTCDSKTTLLPAVQTLYTEIASWHDALPENAKANELSQTPWNDSMVCLGYIHLGHLGALTLITRKTLSIYKPDIGGQKRPLRPEERIQLATILNDGIVAAKQSSRILYLFLGEQASIRHCWSVIYTAFISAAILLYCISQMQLHNYPEHEWQPYLSLVDNDMDVLAYCQELDPVAGTLRDTLSQYMQFLRLPSRAPKPKATPPWARASLNPPNQMPREDPQGQDLVDLLLTVPTSRAGPAQTSMDLLKIVCQPFNDSEAPKSPGNQAPKGYEIPKVLGDLSQELPREPWDQQESDAWMPFGWQQCQTNMAFTCKATNLALTMAQQEMLRAGV